MLKGWLGLGMGCLRAGVHLEYDGKHDEEVLGEQIARKVGRAWLGLGFGLPQGRPRLGRGQG